jgi:hypothetical protein
MTKKSQAGYDAINKKTMSTSIDQDLLILNLSYWEYPESTDP